MAAEIEHLASASAFRFGAAGAYEAIVNQRIQVLREERIGGRQLFAEFMMRRFDPAMRTCRSAKERLAELSGRAERAANLLRTRVDVANQAQNVEVLRAMDRRAALQLRLQETVEGLSVVAISYYAVNLAAGLLRRRWPSRPGLEKAELLALLTVPVVLLVWLHGPPHPRPPRPPRRAETIPADGVRDPLSIRVIRRVPAVQVPGGDRRGRAAWSTCSAFTPRRSHARTPGTDRLPHLVTGGQPSLFNANLGSPAAADAVRPYPRRRQPPGLDPTRRAGGPASAALLRRPAVAGEERRGGPGIAGRCGAPPCAPPGSWRSS